MAGITKKKGIIDIEIHRQLDSRGEMEFTSSLVLALGKTFKSGKMNIPVNMYTTIPNKNGFRVGIL
jgi:hypothetical protein